MDLKTTETISVTINLGLFKFTRKVVKTKTEKRDTKPRSKKPR